MQTHFPAQQTQQNESRTEHKSPESAQSQFEDARPEATAQLRLQSLMANSAQSTQLKSMQAMMATNKPSRNLGQSPGAIDSIPVQRMDDEEPLQAKTDEPVQREQAETANRENPSAQPPSGSPQPQKPNNTGLPDNLKTGIENLSGISMDHVRVHYNSDKPAQLQAHAYAQGSEIHVAPGQEKHLPHEAWHVVQQAQGRVRPTVQMKGGVGVNDDVGLESEADLMGARALSTLMQKMKIKDGAQSESENSHSPVQRKIGFEYDDVTGEEFGENVLFSAEQMFERLPKYWGLPPTEELQIELQALDEVNAIFSDTNELIDVLMQKGITTNHEPNDFLDTAKIGLELTFNNESSKDFVKNDGFPIGKKHEAQAWWKRELIAWTSGMDREDYVDQNELEVEIDKSHEQKELGGGTGDMENWRVLYKRDDKIVWWWQMSMDPGVVEIQAAPTSGTDFLTGIARNIIGSIFDRAASRGFEAGGGGGHVNVDFATGFAEDPSLIPKILFATEQVVSSLSESRNDVDAQLIDFVNETEDPFIGTKRVKMQTTRDGNWKAGHLPDASDERDYSKEWVRDVMRKTKRMSDLKSFRDAHAAWLHLHPTLSQQKGATEQTGKLTEKADEHGLSTVLHYQAVNIDHLFEDVLKDDEEVIEDPRRLEFRFFKGQRNLYEIIECIKLIEKIVNTAKAL